MGTRLLRRRAVAAAGVLAAGVLSGCQSGGQFLHPGVARGDLSAPAAGPATITRAPAGQTLPAAPATGGMLLTAADPGAPMTAGPTVVDSGLPMMNSGGVVSPASYPPGSPMPGISPTPMAVQPAVGQQSPTWAPAGPIMPVQAVTIQTTAMPPLMQAAAIPGTPVTMTTALPPAPPPGTAGVPTLMLIQGPNGPQYVITEVLSAVPLPAPTATPTMMPAPTMMPTAAPAPLPVPGPVFASAPAPSPAPAPMPPMPVTPAQGRAPEPMPAPAVTPVAIPAAAPNPGPVVPAPEPMPPAAPTFTAPPPATVPMPPVPKDLGKANPDRLPPTVSFKPSGGPVLPAADMTASAAPAVTPAGGPKLPASTGAIDDDIPSAPVFLPAAK